MVTVVPQARSVERDLIVRGRPSSVMGRASSWSGGVAAPVIMDRGFRCGALRAPLA